MDDSAVGAWDYPAFDDYWFICGDVGVGGDGGCCDDDGYLCVCLVVDYDRDLRSGMLLATGEGATGSGELVYIWFSICGRASWKYVLVLGLFYVLSCFLRSWVLLRVTVRFRFALLAACVWVGLVC